MNFKRVILIVCFLLTVLLLFPSISLSQNSDIKEKANIPGKRKGPGKSSIENVGQAILTKEREVLAKIHEMMKKFYAPYGGNLSFFESSRIQQIQRLKLAVRPL